MQPLQLPSPSLPDQHAQEMDHRKKLRAEAREDSALEKDLAAARKDLGRCRVALNKVRSEMFFLR
jgi:primosomal protein N''